MWKFVTKNRTLFTLFNIQGSIQLSSLLSPFYTQDIKGCWSQDKNEGSLIWIHRNEFKWIAIVEYCMRLRGSEQSTTQSERDQIKGCQISSLQSLFMWVGGHSKCTSAQRDANASNTGPSSLIYRQRESQCPEDKEGSGERKTSMQTCGVTFN